MKKEVFKENFPYIMINVVAVLLFVVSVVLSFMEFSNSDNFKLLFRVIARGIFGLLIIYNSLYIILTPKWSFLCLDATPKQRLISGIILGVVGVFGLLTAILGYGVNGDPRLIWWK